MQSILQHPACLFCSHLRRASLPPQIHKCAKARATAGVKTPAHGRRCLVPSNNAALVVNEDGQHLTYDALRQRFAKAREAAGLTHEQFQMRDLRAKAGTDKTESAGGIRQAQRQLGHASIQMTEHYVRARKGDKVGPTR